MLQEASGCYFGYMGVHLHSLLPELLSPSLPHLCQHFGEFNKVLLLIFLPARRKKKILLCFFTISNGNTGLFIDKQ